LVNVQCGEGRAQPGAVGLERTGRRVAMTCSLCNRVALYVYYVDSSALGACRIHRDLAVHSMRMATVRADRNVWGPKENSKRFKDYHTLGRGRGHGVRGWKKPIRALGGG
jgi:hypothetical protein